VILNEKMLYRLVSVLAASALLINVNGLPISEVAVPYFPILYNLLTYPRNLAMLPLLPTPSSSGPQPLS
jgi:hypothetical protein